MRYRFVRSCAPESEEENHAFISPRPARRTGSPGAPCSARGSCWSRAPLRACRRPANPFFIGLSVFGSGCTLEFGCAASPYATAIFWANMRARASPIVALWTPRNCPLSQRRPWSWRFFPQRPNLARPPEAISMPFLLRPAPSLI